MNRSNLFKSIFGIALFSATGCQPDQKESNKAFAFSSVGADVAPGQKEAAADLLRQELRAAWLRSEKMTFSDQWRHCVIYTCGQLSAEAGIENPYKNVKLPYQMPKDRIIGELQNMYSIVRKAIEELSVDRLLAECVFAGETIPVWRLFYALENHIIHHRGQCIVYLRLNGVTPKGFYGW